MQCFALCRGLGQRYPVCLFEELILAKATTSAFLPFHHNCIPASSPVSLSNCTVCPRAPDPIWCTFLSILAVGLFDSSRPYTTTVRPFRTRNPDHTAATTEGLRRWTSRWSFISFGAGGSRTGGLVTLCPRPEKRIWPMAPLGWDEQWEQWTVFTDHCFIIHRPSLLTHHPFMASCSLKV